MYTREMSEKIILLFLFAVWWSGNAFYAIDAQYILQSTENQYFILDLAFMQISFGLFASHVMLLISKNRRENSKDASVIEASSAGLRPFEFRDLSVSFVLAGVFNYGGTVLTNWSYQKIGSTSTLVWKLSEPLSVVALKKMILNETTSLWAITGVLIVVCGVLFFTYKGKTLNLSVSSPIIISNIIFPLRNVCVKRGQKGISSKGVEQNALVTYRLLMMISFPFALTFYSWATISGKSVFSLTIAYQCLRNALLFNSYQLASIALLTRLDTFPNIGTIVFFLSEF